MLKSNGKPLWRFPAALTLSLLVVGCAEKKPIPTGVAPGTLETSATKNAAGDELRVSEAAPKKGKPETANPSQSVPSDSSDGNLLTQAGAADVRPFTESAYIPHHAVGLLAIQPQQFLGTPVGRMIAELNPDHTADSPTEILKPFGINLQDVDRAVIVFDQALINKLALELGIQSGDLTQINPEKNQKRDPKNSLKQIYFAFLSHHETFDRLPRADGDGNGTQTGLSWRVHLLPYLDQDELYREFHLDEAWDSEHNKSLIALMPAVFRSPGVTEEGKTSFHVFTGEKTPFHGEQGTRLNGFLDGMSVTILAVSAGSDTADFWTKPGGLEVDLASPKKSLGAWTVEPRLVLIGDGKVRKLSSTIEESLLASMIQHQDGLEVEFPAEPNEEANLAKFEVWPLIMTLKTEVDKNQFVQGLFSAATAETFEEELIQTDQNQAVWFPNPNTVVAGPLASVKEMIAVKKGKTKGDSRLVAQLPLQANASMAVDLASQSALVGQLVQLNPMLGSVTNIKTLAMMLSASGKAGDSLAEVNLTAVDEGMAQGLAGIVSFGLAQGQMGVNQLPKPENATSSDLELFAMVKKLVSSAKVKQERDQVKLRVPVPVGFDRLPVLLKPMLENARAAAKNAQQMNDLKMIGLAFHNLESTIGAFPGAGRLTQETPAGLSWRVHLLPYLDEADLYNKFNLDEPWDSDDNKALIAKMPSIFQTEGMIDPGKSVIHVFVGPQAPFAKDATPKIFEFTDGTSNTILAVVAGPETAEIWTKPGGLDFDPQDPLKSLGTISDDGFLALFADAMVRKIKQNVTAQNLRRLIQLNDGEPIDE